MEILRSMILLFAMCFAFIKYTTRIDEMEFLKEAYCDNIHLRGYFACNPKRLAVVVDWLIFR